MNYLFLKNLHVLLAVCSIAGFVLRSAWFFRGHRFLASKLTRIAPHVIDTVLLATGVALMILLRAYPGNVAWITVKIALIVAYIIFGMRMFRATRPQRQFTWFALAIICVLGVVSLALNKPAMW